MIITFKTSKYVAEDNVRNTYTQRVVFNAVIVTLFKFSLSIVHISVGVDPPIQNLIGWSLSAISKMKQTYIETQS
jgi:hypothetical protein